MIGRRVDLGCAERTVAAAGTRPGAAVREALIKYGFVVPAKAGIEITR